MAKQCDTCGYKDYDSVAFAKHEESVPNSCIRHLQGRVIAAEAKVEAYRTMEGETRDRFMSSVERMAQLLAPKNAKELEKFIGGGY